MDRNLFFGSEAEVLPEAVVFDLDGTLIDSAPDLVASLNKVFGDHKYGELELTQVKSIVGGGARNLVSQALDIVGRSEERDMVDRLTDEFLEDYRTRPSAETVLYPGVREFLTWLKERDIKIGLCTSKPTDIARQILRDFRLLGYFQSVVGGTSGYARKPNPQAIRAILNGLGAEPKSSVMIGDSAFDVAAAHAIDMPVIVMSYGYSVKPAHDLGAELVGDKLADIQDNIGQLVQHAARA